MVWLSFRVTARMGKYVFCEQFQIFLPTTPDKLDEKGKTPLMLARKNDHKRVMELLEPKEAVNPEPKVKRRRRHLVASL